VRPTLILLVGTTSDFCPPYVKTPPHRCHPPPLARAGPNGLPQDCAERIEDSHAQDADLSEPRAVSKGRVRRRLGRAVWHGVSSSPGSPFLWVLSFGAAKESPPPPRVKRHVHLPRSGSAKQKGWPQYRDGMRPTLRGRGKRWASFHSAQATGGLVGCTLITLQAKTLAQAGRFLGRLVADNRTKRVVTHHAPLLPVNVHPVNNLSARKSIRLS
jgi:hypothetical protein